MNWFESFFVTPAMLATGKYQARERIYGAEHRQGKREVQFGKVYDYAAEMKTYTEAMETYTAAARVVDDEAKEDDDDEDVDRPYEPLTPSAYSFSQGPLNQYERVQRVDRFDRGTLGKIVLACGRKPSSAGEGTFASRGYTVDEVAAMSDAQLATSVHAVIETELDYAEMDIGVHPVLELMSGVLLSTNHTLLSRADLARWAQAFGEDASDVSRPRELVDAIVEHQVDLLQEMVDKNDVGDDCRGYNSVRARLRDNKRFLGWFKLDADKDNPMRDEVRERSKRKRALTSGDDDDDNEDDPAAAAASAQQPTKKKRRVLLKREATTITCPICRAEGVSLVRIGNVLCCTFEACDYAEDVAP